ncbi:nuclear transport factor 2 family protein [Cellulomonas dongxiuzhuiae]|uniref:Nuclear transport factor 2 family protein n=1 Tax=Cellulomonas dongxiuzhuiae TaxID=2819979 RepID=A0ABX8GHR4_9CELL|nr:nuclear transport factor 2 family protein [Cellulomonas dongxiuzhuiae]MBO3094426.1 nuclear transport factor 2 family protein [Cellulomonas dongxiuzhuiae]QWC15453.1 nuclear transport factor 2 family protein [Cellulomonas dongxiuzhuiae]
MTTDARGEIVSRISTMYDALGDRPRFDAHLHPDVLMWESDAEGLLRGLPALDTLRDERRARAADGPRPVSVVPHVVAADVWGDTGVVRYELHATYVDGTPDEVFRVTDVLRREDGTWRIVHHHAERRD